jgi:endonuclease YncB( thermonuclease family)
MRRSKVAATACAGLVAAAIVGLAGGDGLRAETLVLEGPARVEDNATLEIWGQRVRLQDILVPDAASAEGMEGKRFLEGLIMAVTVRCVVSARTYRGAMPGRCSAGGIDLGEALVAAGHARPDEPAPGR